MNQRMQQINLFHTAIDQSIAEQTIDLNLSQYNILYMVLNFGLAAGVMYATRKSKLPFKQKLKKLYQQKVLLPPALTLYNIPYFKIILILILVIIQIWVHNVIQRHKQQLAEHYRQSNGSVTISVSDTLGASMNQSARSLVLEEIVGHIGLTLVIFVQILLLKIDRLKISKEQVEFKSYSLVKLVKIKFQTANIQDVRVIRKGRDRISHKTNRLSIRIYSRNGEGKTAFIDFYESISVKVAKLTYAHIIAALRIPFDENKANMVVSE